MKRTPPFNPDGRGSAEIEPAPARRDGSPEQAFPLPGSTQDRLLNTTETWVLSGPREIGIAGQDDAEVAVLSVLAGPRAGTQFRLGREATLGRGDDVDIPIRQGDVSRLHARIVQTEEGFHLLEDLDSRNGTRVNGELVETHELQMGDRVSLGAEAVLLYTRRSQAEEELLEKQRLESLGQLAGGIAHDFNNLLAVIQGNTQLVQGIMEEPDPDSGMVGDCLQDVLEASQRAEELVKQLLGFARRGRWEEAPIDLSAMLHESVELVRRTFDRSIRMDADIEEGLVVAGDRAQLLQVVMNLCFNARDALPEGGLVQLRARSEVADTDPALRGRGPQVRLDVIDHGVGMSPEVQQRVFEPFFTTKRPGAGAGLGLAVVYGVVASHGGRIWLDSQLGQGSSFHVALPAADPRTSWQEPFTPNNTPDTTDFDSTEKGLVLLVDDEPLVRRSVGRMLDQLGYEVETAVDGVEALTKYQKLQHQVSLVLLDLIMPAMSGEEALREIRTLDPSARVLVMSGHHDDATVEKLRADGALGFLVKPFRLDALDAALVVVRSVPLSRS